MLRKRISVVAVLSALVMVVLYVSCGADWGDYLGKAGSDAKCSKMAKDAGCEVGDKSGKYHMLIGTDCFCSE